MIYQVQCRLLLVGFLGLVSLVFLMAGSSKPQGGFRIHLQIGGDVPTTSQSAAITLTNPNETITVSTLPDLSENHIVDVKPIKNGDEMGMRVTFDGIGKTILNNITIEGQGRVMVVYLHDRIVYSPVIDSVISDGVLVIPAGITERDVELMKSIIRRNK